MGVSLAELVEPRKISLGELKGKTIAIDAHNTIYQFLSSIRDRLTGQPLRDSEGKVTSHLSGLFYRMARLLEAGITPVFVFDGEPPESKKETIEARRKIKEEALTRWTKALEEGRYEEARTAASQTSRLTGEMKEESKLLLGYMGISCVQAPSEGEAQAAHMARKGTVYASASQDWDSLLFGAPLLVKNLTISGKRKLPGKEKHISIEPQLIDLGEVLSALGITHDQLIMIGILVGTDFNPGGIKGIGPKKALALVKENKNVDQILHKVEWNFKIGFEEIFNFFRNPPVEDMVIEKRQPDYGKLRELLVAKHGFSAERIDSVIKKLEESHGPKGQAGLGKFFGR